MERIEEARELVRGLVSYTRHEPWLQARLRVILGLLSDESGQQSSKAAPMTKELEQKPKVRKAEVVR